MNRTAQVMVEGQYYYNHNKKRIWIVGIAILFAVILFSVGFLTKTVTAQREGERVKLVISVEIKSGDTLWSIASEHMSDEYDNIKAYIQEIKESNGMDSDDIHSGNYIIVPYYADAT